MDNKNNNRLKTLLYAIDEVNRENRVNRVNRENRENRVNRVNLKIASSGGAHGLTPAVIDIKNQSRYSYDYLKFDTLTSACTLVMRVKEDII